MSAALIILTVLAGAIGIGALLALAWLWHALRWEVVDDDRLDYGISRGRGSGRRWFTAWHRPRAPLLTYRRDVLGRFRRYRR